ncbi:hypothetical protein niasHT_023954 [Heterodera trifolii]|uniref:BED-type domain-containing protein n=1 Tax=Heterodera trifolii TaxID=157864 RepID=A0ABD2JVF5_9BILA
MFTTIANLFGKKKPNRDDDDRNPSKSTIKTLGYIASSHLHSVAATPINETTGELAQFLDVATHFGKEIPNFNSRIGPISRISGDEHLKWDKQRVAAYQVVRRSMSKIWNYFKKEIGIAFCKNCDYKTNFPPKTPTTTLATHLKHKHSELYKEFTEKTGAAKEQQQTFGIKRAFSSSAGALTSTSLDLTLDEEIEEITLAKKLAEQPKIDRIWTRSPWEIGGERASSVHKRIMEFIAVDLQLFSVVEDDRISTELRNAQYISYTTDCWSSTDGAHSLLCLTAHFLIKSRQKFVLLAAKPIKGRHNAPALKELIREALEEFNVKEKSFIFIRDAAEVMVKVFDDLGLRSMDCFAHKLNLAIWDGMRKLTSDTEMKDIFERIKKFIRKYKKSAVFRQEFQEIQKLEQLPQLTLIKEMENVKRESWFNNHDLVLATLLDPRFKLSPYLETTRHDDYINWLISEAEKLAMNENQLQESSCHETDRCEGVGVFDIFADFENSQTAESELFDTTSPIPTVAEITARQKAEFEVKSQYDLGSCTAGEHDIVTTSDTPVSSKPHQTPFKYRDELQKHIDQLLASGVMVESDTPWVSNIVLVQKKDDASNVGQGGALMQWNELSEAYEVIAYCSRTLLLGLWT